jgi:hypothetical protein
MVKVAFNRGEIFSPHPNTGRMSPALTQRMQELVAGVNGTGGNRAGSRWYRSGPVPTQTVPTNLGSRWTGRFHQ